MFENLGLFSIVAIHADCFILEYFHNVDSFLLRQLRFP